MKAFATKTELLPHQRDAVAKLRQARVGALFADMGTGKSRMAIELAKIRAGKISRVIWACPVSLKLTMKHEILKHTDCAENDIYVFGDKTKAQNVPLDKRWYIVGIESLSSSIRVLYALRRIADMSSMVVCDESTYIKGPAAMRTMRLDSACAETKYRLVMTGTPLTNGEQDLYAQMHFLSPLILGYRSYYSFARHHIEYSEKYPGKIVAVHNKAYLAAKMAPYVYQITKGECLNLPKKLYEGIYFELTDEQWKAYETAKDEFLRMSEPEDWTSVHLFRLFTALQSIVCGFWRHAVYNGDFSKKFGESFTEFEHGRLSALMDAVNGIPGKEKVVVWSKFRYCQKQIADALRGKFGPDSVAEYHGGLDPARREEEQAKFTNGPARFFVGTQSAGGHGLTLTQAHHAIFYADGFKFSERLQAEDRCHRIGQTMPVTYVSIRADCKMEDRIARALGNKSDVLADFRREIEKIKRRSGKKAESKLRELVKNL
ncbi:DEAD/DEAH box helicase [Pyramidobacter piscolens]|uniref:DEAD/DEAH box helicase n=1 Tax=Pyramidobacter piscolens TaxID=638849 RepID=UPI002AB29DBA|nr:DEAD/DEAH box helicase [Pyramidobacter piscolens]